MCGENKAAKARGVLSRVITTVEEVGAISPTTESEVVVVGTAIIDNSSNRIINIRVTEDTGSSRVVHTVVEVTITLSLTIVTTRTGVTHIDRDHITTIHRHSLLITNHARNLLIFNLNTRIVLLLQHHRLLVPSGQEDDRRYQLTKKPSGLRAGRKLANHRRNERWSSKKYNKSHSVSHMKANPLG
eukprot:gene22516-28649_t